MSTGLQQEEFLPVRGLANVLVVVLPVIVAAIAARLAVDVLRLSGTSGPVSTRLDVATDITIPVWTILFLVWFYRARVNAEAYDYPQRRARSWAFWGWIVPIVNLWIPFQVMGDIWRAGLPPWQRTRTAWLPALWWTSWLLSGVGFGGPAMAANRGGAPHLGAATNAFSLAFLAVSGALLTAIIRAVSRGPVGTLPAA